MPSLINIKRDHRVFIVAATGGGKTFLARKLLIGRPHVVVVDPKHTFRWERGKQYDDIYESFAELASEWQGPAPAIYRPTDAELDDFLAPFWKWAWKLKNLLVYVDEVTEITPPSRPAPGLRKALKMGREHGLSVWVSSQRPSLIPTALMSEAEQYFVGELRYDEDRKKMARFSNRKELLELVDNKRFWYYDCHRRVLAQINARDIRVVSQDAKALAGGVQGSEAQGKEVKQ